MKLSRALPLLALGLVAGLSGEVVRSAWAQVITGYYRVQDEASNLPKRQTLDLAGDYVTCVDTPATLTTSCTIEAPALDAWTAPTLVNSWVDHTPATFSPAGYLKDSLGFVHLRGLIKSGTTTPGTTMFTLPSGYRPAFQSIFRVANQSGGVEGDARIDVQADGDVAITTGGNQYLSLEGVTFRADGS